MKQQAEGQLQQKWTNKSIPQIQVSAGALDHHRWFLRWLFSQAAEPHAYVKHRYLPYEFAAQLARLSKQFGLISLSERAQRFPEALQTLLGGSQRPSRQLKRKQFRSALYQDQPKLRFTSVFPM